MKVSILRYALLLMPPFILFTEKLQVTGIIAVDRRVCDKLKLSIAVQRKRCFHADKLFNLLSD